ncbi:MAG: Gldg family protein [Phycisphaeraceae bacterium]|nr:Gldg family protein [Phycisphaeraceae bacterium]
MNARIAGIASLVLLAILLVAVNVLAGAALRSVRLDLTDGGLYTLTQGSKNIAKSPAEPVTLTFYYSAKAAQGVPQIEGIAGRIGEMLEEFARDSDGKIVVQNVDPEAFSEDEDRAVQAGLTGLPSPSGESIYLGLVGTNTIGGREVIPLFDITNERFLEYDVAKLVQVLSMSKKPVVSIVSSLDLAGGFTIDPRTQQPMRKPGWAVMQELKQLYDVKTLQADNLVIPAETSVLLIVHPKNFNLKAQFAIDQFVLKGGKAIIFVDPLCMADEAAAQQRMQPGGVDLSSNLENLFNAWGVGYDPKLIAADATLGTRLTAGQGGRQQQIVFPPWITVDQRGFNKSDPVSGKLTSVNFAMAGALTHKPPADPTNKGGELTPIIETTDNSMLLQAAAMLSLTDPASVLADFKSSGQKLTLGARLTGNLKTAFPQGDPAASNADESKQGPEEPVVADSLKESAKPANLLIIADVDVLSDRLWIQQTAFGAMKVADNVAMLTTAIDSYIGSGDLLGVRARGEYTRPFTRVEEIKRGAEQRLRAEAEQLKQKAEAAQQRILEIERTRPDQSDQGVILLTDAQQKELEKLRAERLETRKQLRKVQFDLGQDVQKLGERVKLINIGLVPVVVMLIAVLWAAFRAIGRKSARTSA